MLLEKKNAVVYGAGGAVGSAVAQAFAAAEVYGLHAEAHGISRDAFRSRMTELTLRKRLPTVAEVADVAAFVASDRAGAITGAITNLTGGLVVG